MGGIDLNRTKTKNSFILILLVLISLSWFCFLDSSNGVDVDKNNDLSNNLYDNIGALKNADDSNETNVAIGMYGGYNESSNVILEFNIRSYHVHAMCGGSTEFLSFNISLRYKDSNEPLSNQNVYLIIGNTTNSYTTDKNGMISVDNYQPNIYGDVNFKVLFNGATFLYNSSMVDLEPVSIYFKYFLHEPSGGGGISPSVVNIYAFKKNNTNSEPNKNNSKLNTSNSKFNINNSQNGYAGMEKTGLPLIQLILSLMFILGFLIYKK